SCTHVAPLRGGSFVVAAHEGVRGRLILLDSKGKSYSEIVPHETTGDDLNPCLSLLRVGFEDAPAETDLDSPASLSRGLKSKDVLVRQRCAIKLEQLGARATEALPALVEALADPDAEVQNRAALALNNCGERALPHFLKALKHPDAAVRAEG